MRKREIQKFKGSHREIGRQKGSQYKKWGCSPPKPLPDDEIFRHQLEKYEEFYPEILEELSATAQCAGFPVQHFVNSAITTSLRSPERETCTIVGVRSKTATFIARNYDWNAAAKDVFEVYTAIPEQGYAFTALSDMDTGRHEEKDVRKLYIPLDAINTQGLYIGLTFAHSGERNYGLSPVHMIQMISEKCSNVEEAKSLFEEVPICYPKNFFIADRNGNMVVVEHTSQRFKIIEPTDGILIKTNHYIDRELSLQEDSIIDSQSTYLRFNNAKKSLGSIEHFGTDQALHLLRDPSAGVFQSSGEMETIWSLVLNLTERKYIVHYGTGKSLHIPPPEST